MDELERLNEVVNSMKEKMEDPDWVNKLSGSVDEDIERASELLMGPLMGSKLKLDFVKTSPDAITPKYNYAGDSGFDLYSTESIVIEGESRALVNTGLAFSIPNGYEIQVRSKSGIALNRGVFVLNSPGTVDSSYTGEVKVILFNTKKTPYHVNKGEKIAQAVLCPVINGGMVEIKETSNLTDTDRGDKGFGSTGI